MIAYAQLETLGFLPTLQVGLLPDPKCRTPTLMLSGMYDDRRDSSATDWPRAGVGLCAARGVRGAAHPREAAKPPAFDEGLKARSSAFTPPLGGCSHPNLFSGTTSSLPQQPHEPAPAASSWTLKHQLNP
jgi:hypothetical protein